MYLFVSGFIVASMTISGLQRTSEDYLRTTTIKYVYTPETLFQPLPSNVILASQ